MNNGLRDEFRIVLANLVHEAVASETRQAVVVKTAIEEIERLRIPNE